MAKGIGKGLIKGVGGKDREKTCSSERILVQFFYAPVHILVLLKGGV